MNFIDLLPKMDASVATVSRDFACPECDNSGVGYPMMDKPKLVGWCDTPYGYMMIVECPHCYAKYRFHGSNVNKNDLSELESAIRSYVIARYFLNSEELEQKFNENEQR